MNPFRDNPPPCSELGEDGMAKYAHLFDSQHPADHVRAAQLCAGCPFRGNVCASERDAAMTLFPGAVHGTWNGEHHQPLGKIGRPRRKAAA